MIRLGPLRPHDRERVAEVLVSTAAFSSEEVDVALELFDAVHPQSNAAADGDYELVGAFDASGHLMGYVCFGPTPATDGTYDLYWLAVDPASQGQGVGRTLLRHVESSLAKRRARLLVVETSSRADYAQTRTFYARSGYAEVARVRDFYAPADDRIILTARITTREGGVATQ